MGMEILNFENFRSPNAAEARQAKKRENHVKSLTKNAAKGVWLGSVTVEVE